MRKIQILRGTFAKKPNLEDGQMYLAKDTKQVFVGDKAITEGEIEFANKSDLTALANEVNTQASDIADIQADYAQTTGGNTVTANGVVVSDENGKLKSITGNANQIVQFNGNKVPVAVDADFASKSELNNYLPLSGGEMVGPITLGANLTLVKRTNQDGGTNVVDMTDTFFTARNTAGPSDANNNAQVLIQTRNKVPTGDDPYAGVDVLGLKVEVREKGFRASTDNVERLTFDLNGGLTTHVVDPSDERMPTPKSYVDNAISAISSVNIEVSETQPTNQKAGDFWYHVTGTV